MGRRRRALAPVFVQPGAAATPQTDPGARPPPRKPPAAPFDVRDSHVSFVPTFIHPAGPDGGTIQALVATLQGTCLVNCRLGDAAAAADARQLCALAAALSSLAPDAALTTAALADGRAVALSRGQGVVVAVVGAGEPERFRAHQVRRAFELTFAKSLPRRLERDAEAHDAALHSFSARSRRAEPEPAALATEAPYRAFQEAFLRPLLAAPAPALAWLRPLVEGGGALAAAVLVAGEPAALAGAARHRASRAWRCAQRMAAAGEPGVRGRALARRLVAHDDVWLLLTLAPGAEVPARAVEDVVRAVAHALPAKVVGVPTPFSTALRPVAPAAPRRPAAGARPTPRFRDPASVQRSQLDFSDLPPDGGLQSRLSAALSPVAGSPSVTSGASGPSGPSVDSEAKEDPAAAAGGGKEGDVRVAAPAPRFNTPKRPWGGSARVDPLLA